MRYLTTFGAVALTMVLWNPGTSCTAQTSPSGSYQQSCRNIGVNGSTLYANCQNINGEWQSTQLQDFQRCAGEIGNNNGALRCDMRENSFQPVGQGNWQIGQGNWQNGAPSGGYTQTCQEIRTSGNTLEANCKTMGGQWTRTSLPNFNQCIGEIENNDGRLVCNKGGNNGHWYRNGDQQGDRRDNGQGYGNGDQQGDRRDNGQGYRNGDRQNGAPYGGYSQTCQDIRTNGFTLQANCQKKNGKWRQASLRHFNQCVGEIENNNGKLVCSR
jgi:hypothetical protein